jgi:hypothetical protein
MTITTDTRAMTLVDLPLIRRLTSSGAVLDSELGLTRDARGPHSLLLSSLVFSRGLYTLLARAADNQSVVGQFRYRPDDLNAHIVYIAPSLDVNAEDTLWLHVLDAMAREAGKHGAHALVAEVETSSCLFETLRTARFASYTRQTIWRRDPFEPAARDGALTLEDETSSDQIGILSLISCIVPPMLQQIATPPGDMPGLVYRQNGRVEAWIGISEGKQGIYLLPFIHPDVMSQAGALIDAAIRTLERATRLPVYVCVRSYQSWLNELLADMGFESWVEQAVMVKQIAAGIRHPAFARMEIKGTLHGTSGVPHSWSMIAQQCSDEEFV